MDIPVDKPSGINCYYNIIKQVNHVSYMWLIEDFSKHCVDVGKSISSSCFEALENDWRISIFPNGDSDKNAGFISIFLYRNLNETMLLTSVGVTFTFSIMSSGGQDLYERTDSHIFEGDIAAGYSQFVHRSQLANSHIERSQYDYLTICCEVTSYDPQDGDLYAPPSELGKNLKQMFQEQHYGDFIFNIEGKKIKAYKGILASQSLYFAEMFKDARTKGCEINEMDITDCKLVVFQEMLNFIHTGKALKLKDMAKDMLPLADKYRLLRLKCFCERELYSQLSVDNSVSIYAMSRQYSASQLKHHTLEFIRTNRRKVYQSGEFKKIDAYKLQLLKEILLETGY